MRNADLLNYAQTFVESDTPDTDVPEENPDETEPTEPGDNENEPEEPGDDWEDMARKMLERLLRRIFDDLRGWFGG